jgi:hypothetical protein
MRQEGERRDCEIEGERETKKTTKKAKHKALYIDHEGAESIDCRYSLKHTVHSHRPLNNKGLCV